MIILSVEATIEDDHRGLFKIYLLHKNLVLIQNESRKEFLMFFSGFLILNDMEIVL